MPLDLVSPVFVGRTRELQVLADAAARAEAREPAFTLLGGDAGVGKSRLVEEFAAGRAEAGVVVLRGHCVDLGEDAIPFGPFLDALRQLERSGAEAAEGVRGLLPDVAGGSEGVGVPDRGERTYRLHDAVAGLLETQSVDHPILLVLEDLHWADRATRDLLAALARTLRDSRVHVVATWRSDDLTRGHPLRRVLAELERLPQVDRMELQPFSRDEVSDQLSGILGSAPAVRVVDRIFDRSEGNPFFVEELACSGPGDGALSESTRELVLSRLERHPDTVRRMLHAAAVCGTRVPYSLLLAIAVPGSTPDEEALQEALRSAVDTNLLRVEDDEVVFRHALLREALHDDVLPGEHQRLHVAAARALRDRPDHMMRRRRITEEAHHWNAARVAEEALPTALQAADVAGETYAFADQLRLLERAMTLWPTVPDASERAGVPLSAIQVRAAEAAASAGEGDRSMAYAEEALLQARREGDRRREALVLGRLGKLKEVFSRPGGIEDIRQALRVFDGEQVGPADDPDRLIIVDQLAGMLVLSGRLEEGGDLAREALELVGDDASRRANLLSTLSCAVLSLGRIEEGLEISREAQLLSQEHGDSGTQIRAVIHVSDRLCGLGRFAEAVEVAASGAELAAEVGLMRTSGALLVGNEVEPMVWLGRLDEGDAELQRALLHDPAGTPRAFLHHLLARIRLLRGDLDGSREAIDRARSQIGEVHLAMEQHAAPLTYALAQLSLAEGDVDGALEAIDAVLGAHAMHGTARYQLPVLTVAAEATAALAGAAARAGDDAGLARAGRWRDRVSELLDKFGTPTPPTAGWRAEADAWLTGVGASADAESWQLAAEAFDKAGMPIERSRALTHAAEALLAGGVRADRAYAQSALEDARAIALDCAAGLVATEIDALVRRYRLTLADVPPRGVEEPITGALGSLGALTPREREVLALVAEGLSNRAIGERLFLSPKTVSVHVSNILAKLGVSGRGEAAALAHRLGLLEPPVSA